METVTLSGVAVGTRKSWIKISNFIETVHIPSRKQNVLIPPQNEWVARLLLNHLDGPRNANGR